jgi:hypothetical protein
MNAAPSQHSIQGSFATALIFVATIAAKFPAKNPETLTVKHRLPQRKNKGFTDLLR